LNSRKLLQRYRNLFRSELASAYSRDIQKWLLVAPLVGILAGLLIAAITFVILRGTWAILLPYYLNHHWAIIPGIFIGFVVTGLIMQFLTPDPDEHSTEEIIRSYHERQGQIDFGPFWYKLIAAVTTVGTGGSAALEGPSIYGGGAIGSWVWTRLRKFGTVGPRDRRIMLISGAAAGMAAVFRAPLTGIVFALEMPYKDDLAHEALLPSLIASVIAYTTLVGFVGPEPLFNFIGGSSFRAIDLLWSALLGALCGIIAMAFALTFRLTRQFAVHAPIPHWSKLAVGGLLTGVCGLIFVSKFPGALIPLGPNYEAVGQVLTQQHSSIELVWFAFLKLAATLFSLGSGGVSAMFVPLFLTGASIGTAYAQELIHAGNLDLYAAVGMAAFIAAGYKTPLTAVVFVAEATGGHAYIIPSLIGAAVAYAISGETSVSGDQHLHESIAIADLSNVAVRDIMKRGVISVRGDETLEEFFRRTVAHYPHSVYPVCDERGPIGVIAVAKASAFDSAKWGSIRVDRAAERDALIVAPDCDLREALRMLMNAGGRHHMLLVVSSGELQGIVTKSDILSAARTLR
jgi:CIC family chloride channel protein